ncbi:ABC transporter substrate-binding protein [Nesterenkonia rhizosphaerae]
MMRKTMTPPALLVAAALGLTACGGDNPGEAAEAGEVNTNESIESLEDVNEAPTLTELVSAGELPELAERLPVAEDIMVEPVLEQIGEHGGTWNMPWNGIDSPWGIGKITEEALFRFAADGDGVEPNVAKGYEVNDDYTEFTIFLREGMKWSDGEPFTARDVIFWWEHVMKPEIFQRGVYDAFYSTDPETGERAQAVIEQVDDHTFTVSFEHPRVLFLERLAIDAKWMFAPAHYLENILDEFVGEEEAMRIASEHGFADLEGWYEHITYYFWIWPDRPSLRAWVATEEPRSNNVTWERNPYYWKTDAEGNQLPYIDQVVLESVQDDSHVLLETMSGHFDISQFGFGNFTELAENQEQGDYRILQWEGVNWASDSLMLNQTVQDDQLRELFQDARFREALSVAVDREELSEILTLGLGAPQQASINQALPFHQEGWAEQWAEYDVERAGELLDELGLEYDGDYRTLPDGSELRLEILQESDDAQAGDFEELLQHYFEAVGIRTDVRLVDRGTLDQTLLDNEHVATTAFGPGGISPYLRPDTVVPVRDIAAGNTWFGEFGCMYEQVCEPSGDYEVPEAIEQMWDLWAEVSSATDTEAIEDAAEQIVKLHQDNQWVLGYTGPVPMLIAVSNDIVNVPDGVTFADEFRDLGHGRPAQFSFVGLED